MQVNLLCGGTHAGHVALWDDRTPSSPCRLTGYYSNYVFTKPHHTVLHGPNIYTDIKH
jgi:hypothetical protein